MTLTRKQQRVAFNLIVSSIIAVVFGLFGLVCWALASSLAQPPASAQPNVHTVNTQRYEKISLGNDDGTVDHFCLGTTGLWYGPNSGDFAVVAGDPLCR